MTHILRDPFTPHSCPKKSVHEIGQKSRNILRTRGVGLKTACTPMDQSKTRNPSNIKTPQVRFPLSKGAGKWDRYLKKSESIVHWHEILPTFVIRHTLHSLTTSYPTLRDIFSSDHFKTHEMRIITEIKWERGNRKKEREGQQTALTLDPALHKKHALTSQESSPALPAVCSPRRLNGHPVESKE